MLPCRNPIQLNYHVTRNNLSCAGRPRTAWCEDYLDLSGRGKVAAIGRPRSKASKTAIVDVIATPCFTRSTIISRTAALARSKRAISPRVTICSGHTSSCLQAPANRATMIGVRRMARSEFPCRPPEQTQRPKLLPDRRVLSGRSPTRIAQLVLSNP